MQSHEIICSNRDSLVICALFPWSILLDKLTITATHRNGVIASHASLLKKLILKILNIPVLKHENGLIVWGYFHEEGNTITDVDKRPLYPVMLTSHEWYMVLKTKLPKILALVLSEIDRVVKFALVGGSGVIVNLTLAEITYRYVSGIGLIAKPLASTIGFETSVTWNFILHETWTFREIGLRRDLKSVLKRFIKYNFASVISWISQVTLATLLPVFFKTSFLMGQFVGIVTGFIINFILGYIYTWSIHRI